MMEGEHITLMWQILINLFKTLMIKVQSEDTKVFAAFPQMQI